MVGPMGIRLAGGPKDTGQEDRLPGACNPDGFSDGMHWSGSLQNMCAKTDESIQDTTPRDMGRGVRAMQASFAGKSQRGRLREYRLILFYDQGREYRVVAYWNAAATENRQTRGHRATGNR